MPIDAGDHRFSFLVLGPDYNERAGAIPGKVKRKRARQFSQEAAQPAAADDEQVGVERFLAKDFRGQACNHSRFDFQTGLDPAGQFHPLGENGFCSECRSPLSATPFTGPTSRVNKGQIQAWTMRSMA